MKNTLGIILIGALVASLSTPAMAEKREKKTPPKSTRIASEAIQAEGEEHFPEKMQISKIGSIKMETTYYHIYTGALQKGGYHVIVFDNKPEYLGYYKTELEVSGYEDGGSKEGAILIDMGDGNKEKIRIKQTGPADIATIDGVKSYFVKVPEKKKVSSLVKKSKGAMGEIKPEFRKWTITEGSKKMTVRAIYVSQDFGKVTVRAEASGAEGPFAKSSLSDEDKAYIEQFK